MRTVWIAIASAAFLAFQAPQVEAFGAPESFADLADQVSPAVVNITTSTVVEAPAGTGPMVPEGSPFEDFFKDFNDQFGDQPGGPGNRGPQRANALGSGFVISEDGFIVTNNHVIEGADEIQIEFFSGETLDAKLVGTDPKTDIAVLKVESEDALPFVNFGDSDRMRVGDWVMAMGNPLGQGFSVSAGIISARNRELQGAYDDFIQTDAAINKGNSGGPLFNMNGEVIGVNTAILSPTGGSIGIGFSMASNVVTKVVDQLRNFGETRRGWLGVKIQDVTPDVAEAMGLETAHGALVTDVPDGPAKEAGVQSGDVIVEFDGHEVKDSRELVRTVGDAEVGKPVPITVLRNGESVALTITLGRREEAEGVPVPAKASPTEPMEKSLLGMKLNELTDEMRSQLNLSPEDQGLLVTDIDQSSEAFTKGLRAGDLITEAGQARVASIKDLESRIEEAKEAGRKSLLLLIRREGDPRFVAISVE
ncbi:DegQ family serine endoprotease [Frigidibacter sp. RF13]|uniref:DegQ family serine endoprotease n=1 Tax=Frigidibacter sp. RF13 TaxID=2997340 RepID=UPI00227127FA|nr:DegQ family serine endoprotease [Frigidibacter sp. RF13]MCY1126936.1 DegQ family serine endoprotease [Frigidibacter sp. RF13]